MAKRCLLIFSLIFLNISAAQEPHFGVKAGLNLSTVTGNNVSEGVNPRLAYHFGGFANIPLSDRFSLNPELLYFSIGSTFNFTFDDFIGLNPTVNNSFKTAERANFLAIPVNFSYSFTENFGLDFGPQVSFLINTTTRVKEAPDNVDAFNQKVQGNFRPDYGANIGLTFSPTEKLNFQLRYYQGLKNLSFFQEDRSFNVALQLSVGYFIF